MDFNTAPPPSMETDADADAMQTKTEVAHAHANDKNNKQTPPAAPSQKPSRQQRKKKKKKSRILKPDYVDGDTAFMRLATDVKYGQFARDVHSLNGERFVTRMQMRQVWQSTVRQAHHRWARDKYDAPDSAKERAFGGRLLEEALAQADGYEGFDLDAYWDLQGAMREMDALSMTADRGAKLVTGCEKLIAERLMKLRVDLVKRTRAARKAEKRLQNFVTKRETTLKTEPGPDVEMQ
ncbi:uncharacterized protein L3040_004289 [Drepanopeziza brunnea f. sp. 'multigermtubi']|uniref:Uncharacterized protein n=1 Tax=Marssonina brunnea f. sp. multigermtubi (strain MB_m1) TaxID=1072389 RepID=K1Y5G0_MARBU|nr:uncharacterized protein MBM_01106 [Drepanopeziza brunnea f. sp. 'multigermtubi' MB_m1]EKD20424.1 hypothetical protein MBM_01106 [Drepanopeziza brunnea f. sp. 'multigermtubi' MB_m1]KAJ5042898.1 hypothetical protein L3040_004289 [Drepanopeziza brunnea f. sp. 'multigermtubi']